MTPAAFHEGVLCPPAWWQCPCLRRKSSAQIYHQVNSVCLQCELQAAVAWVEHEVRRLLSGGCELWELVMTVRALL